MKNKKEENIIELKDYSVSLGGKEIIKKINLKIKKGEIIGIVGPNGCGKTTLLNSIAGLESYSGEIFNNSSNMGFVTQNTQELLFNWLDIKDNAAFPKRFSNLRKEEKRLLLELLIDFGLKNYLDKYPYELSGGMQQILLVIRAIINKCDLILMDESFKSLDFEISKKIQVKLSELWKKNQTTGMLVSHDLEEAILLCDKIIVLSKKPTVVKKIFDLSRLRREEKVKESKKIGGEVLYEFFKK